MNAKDEAIATVSRGERPTGQFSIEVDARRASAVAGTQGLALGLTDDWSEFYVFEVYPDLQLGLLWYQQNGQWTLINYVESGAIRTGQGSNHLKVEMSTASGYVASFSVNGAYIDRVFLPYSPTAQRRVGLTVTSDAAGFDARFDNYKLVPEGCPASSSSTAQDAQMAPRALFESTRLKNLDPR
jgi:hypothetical protein